MRARDGAYTFVRVEGRGEAYEVWRDGAKVATFVGSLAEVMAYYREKERRDREVARALRSGDPRGACRLGWHRLAGYGLWFRYATGREGRMLIYRVGPEPFEHRCRTMWCHGQDARRWVCHVCGEKIPTGQISIPSVRRRSAAIRRSSVDRSSNSGFNT